MISEIIIKIWDYIRQYSSRSFVWNRGNIAYNGQEINEKKPLYRAYL